MKRTGRLPGWAAVVIALVAVAGFRQAFVLIQGLEDPSDPARRPTTNSTGPAESRYARPILVGRIEDPDITESSGLVASRDNPGVLWTHNDSGGEPTIYCVTLVGRSCGTWTLAGADAIDWEDIALGPGPGGGSFLYVGDIGDNERARQSVTVYRLPEPAVEQGGRAVPAEALEFRYPDRSHDAETLLIHPDTGDLYVVTKELSSRSDVFRATAPLRSGETFVSVGKIRISDLLSDRTGGDISPDGTRVVLSTYSAAYELELPAGASFDEIWVQPLTEIDVGAREQGEAITYSADGTALFTTSEGTRPPLYKIPVRD